MYSMCRRGLIFLRCVLYCLSCGISRFCHDLVNLYIPLTFALIFQSETKFQNPKSQSLYFFKDRGITRNIKRISLVAKILTT